jgi:rod shape-determining protein MreD
MPSALSFRRRPRDSVARPRTDTTRGLSFRRGKPRPQAPRGAGELPSRLSFRRGKHRPQAPRGAGPSRLSFRRGKARPQSPRGAGELPSRLSFRRRRSRKPLAPREGARSLSFRRRRRSDAPAGGERSAAGKLAARLRRRERAAPRSEPDALALALRLLWLGLAAGMLQLLVVSQIAVDGVSADVTPLVVVAAGFLCGSLPGAYFGFALGLFVDLAFVQTLGISSLLFTLIGYGAGRLRELRAPAAPLTRLLLGTAATVTALGGYGAIEFMLGINTPVSAGLLGAIVKTTALNSLIAVPVYALTRRALLPALPVAERRPQEAITGSGGLSPLSRA